MYQSPQHCLVAAAESFGAVLIHFPLIHPGTIIDKCSSLLLAFPPVRTAQKGDLCSSAGQFYPPL
jgi:hypothetical protein